MNKILITGGAGFIGFALSKKLSDDSNNQITIIDNLLRGKLDDEFEFLVNRDNVKFINADITDAGVFLNLDKDYDYVYHLAAVIGVKNVMKNPDKVLYVNSISTLNLLEFLKNNHNLKKILFSSTSEIYSGTLKNFGIDIPTDETVKLTVEDIKSERTTYALSKMFGESVCFNYGNKYSIPFTIVRYHNVYGPRMGFAHVVPEMFVKIKNNNKVDVPSPTHSRAFCFIDDAIEMTKRACENENTNNEILHIGNSKEEIQMKDLVLKISKIIGKTIELNEQPDTPGSTARRCPDVSKIKKLTGYTAAVSLDEGIAKTYNWYEDKLDKVYE